MSYVDTFVRVAPDCLLERAVVPPARSDKPAIAELEYGLLSAAPYRFTERETQFAVHLARQGLSEEEASAKRASLEREFFAKCARFRASPLPKKFGWGLHYDAEGRIALYAVESAEYRRLADDPSLKQLAAMRTSRS